MAHAAPKLAPVVNLGWGTGTPDGDDTHFNRFLQLPPELRIAVYEHYFDDIGTVPSLHLQPDLTLASKQLRRESLPLFYNHSTFGAAMDIWPFPDIYEETELCRETYVMLHKMPIVHLDSIRHIKISLIFDLDPLVRIHDVHLDMASWHKSSRAVHIERMLPKSTIPYHDRFAEGIQEAVTLVFSDLRPCEAGGRVCCKDVLTKAEEAFDLIFWDTPRWLEVAKEENRDAVNKMVEKSRASLGVGR